MKVKEVKKSDFILAKEISSFEILQEVFIEPETVGNFRKYLRDFTKHTDKLFVTKTIEGKIRVTRLK